MAVRPQFFLYLVFILFKCKYEVLLQKVTPGMVIVLYGHFLVCTSFLGNLPEHLTVFFSKKKKKTTTKTTEEPHKQPTKNQPNKTSPKQKSTNTCQKLYAAW